VVAPDGRRWAYKPVGMVLASLFVLYHVLVLLQHTTPSAGLAAQFNKTLGDRLKAGQWMRAASSIQSWSMFARTRTAATCSCRSSSSSRTAP
jgi:hypothetical protein